LRHPPAIFGPRCCAATLFAALAIAGAAQGTVSSAWADSSLPSAIGNETVFGLAVSPAYPSTGLVLAISHVHTGCTGPQCINLWVTHDGGALWSRPQANGWLRGRVTIAVDARGHEILFSDGSGSSGGALQRSDDGGQSWKNTASPGFPTPTPSYARDDTPAVAGEATRKDYLLVNGRASSVTGSGGSLTDLSFTYSPSWPDSGIYAPALLAGLDRKTGLPVLERCKADLSCSAPSPLPGAQPYPFDLHLSTTYAQDGIVFARSASGVYKSLDGGNSFTLRPIINNGATYTTTPMMALGPGYREAPGPAPLVKIVKTVYVAVSQYFIDKTGQNTHTSGGIYVSEDGGISWGRVGVASPLDEGATAVAVAPDGRLFAGYRSLTANAAGLLCSADGHAWIASCPSIKTTRGSSAGSGGGTAGGGSQPASSSTVSGGGAPGSQSAGSVSAKDPVGRVVGAVRTTFSPGHPWALALAVILALAAGIAALAVIVRRKRSPQKT